MTLTQSLRPNTGLARLNVCQGVPLVTARRDGSISLPEALCISLQDLKAC